MEEANLRGKLPGKVSGETKKIIERELEALRIYLELRSKKKRKKLPVEKYMGVLGEASVEELNAYALEAEGFESVDVIEIVK